MGLIVQPSALDAQTLPAPEDVFLSWLLAQPSGANLSEAADVEIERLARYAGPHEGPRRLVAIFAAFRDSLSGRKPCQIQ